MIDLAVIYCRKSDPNTKSDDPAFDQQEQVCRKYCEEKGYTVLVARRESYTGTDLENQNLLWDCIDDIRRGRANVVVAYSYDRLSREPQMQEVALYEIERKYGGSFEAATEQIDRDDPFREAIRGMLGAAGKVERRRISQRMLRGKVDRSQRGALYGAGVAKFGYKWADPTPGGHTTWLVDEQSAETVRRIFDWFDNGKGARWIARQLNSEGVPTPSRTTESQGHIGRRKVSDVWQHWPIMSILGEPAYCGKMDAYRRQVSWDYIKNPSTGIMEKKKVVTRRDETDPARIALECPAIVSVEQFQRVQLILQSNKRKEGRPPLDPEEAVMRGHVWCKCGRKMVLVRTSKGYYVYRCRARPNVVTDPSIQCPYGDQQISARPVNEFGRYMAAKLAEKADVLEQFLQGKDEENQPLRTMTENLTALVERKTAERDKYLTGIAAAKDSTVVSVLVEKAEQAAKEAQDAQAKLAEAQARLTSVDQRRASFEKVIVSLYHASGKVHDLETDDMRALLDLIGLRVTVSPDTGKLMEQERVTRNKRTITYVRDRWSRMVAEYNLRGQEFSGCVFSKSME